MSTKRTTRATKSSSSRQRLKDPRGGLTAAGRRHFARKDGAHLKPGVRGAADTPEKLRRKGSFLRRHFAHPRGPLVNEQGEPTRLALSAHAWGEPVPKTMAAAKKLADKGTRLLERYAKTKETSMAAKKKATKKRSTAKKRTTAKKAGTRRAAPRKKAARKASSGRRTPAKNSLVGNINRRKKAGNSRPKSRSTVSKSAYDAMQRGWR
jgi:hypothetical protein